jgi:hypothetical protein
MKYTCLSILSVICFINGCTGIVQDTGKRSIVLSADKCHVGHCDSTSSLVGVWKLVSFHTRDASGKMTYPFGQDARGRLIYEPNGRMAVQLMDSRRPRFTADDPLITSEAELRQAFGGYAAYYGTYSINPDEQTIVHHIEAALIPNWAGTDQKRHFEYDGKYLTLSGPLKLGGIEGKVSLVWERLP